MTRLIIVSNRLPMSLYAKPDGTFALKQNIGGLATAIGPYHKSHSDCHWVGWSGIDPQTRTKEEVEAITAEFDRQRCVPIFLSEREIDGYYAGYSNDTLWPLFHDFAHEAKFDPQTWKVYQEVNQKFAGAVASILRPDDTVWIQDYHLMLLPAMLRSRFPKLRIGWFLHIPFPSPEIFHQLPNGADLLRGLLGADLIGFHTVDFCANFMAVLRMLLGLDVGENGRIAVGGNRFVTVDAFPIGIDYNLYRRTAHSSLAKAMRNGIEAVSGKRTRRLKTSLSAESKAALEARSMGDRLLDFEKDELPEEVLAKSASASGKAMPNKDVISVDRLDYTKGLPERLRAFALMLDRYPEWIGHVTYYLLATPSREDVETYRRLKQQVDQLVGDINGKYSLLSWTPIHYITRSLPIKPVCGIYAAGDVALVTPLRDGMNLVAKEYLACRDGRDGALVLSDMCGAARELTDAYIVNPYDIDAVCEALHSALTIDTDEAKRRNKTMQTRLQYRTASLWSTEFLSTLRQVSDPALADRRLESLQRDKLVDRWGKSRRKLLLLDYDGTLTPLVRTPDRAKPTRRLLDLLRRLGSQPDVDLYIVSGRDRDTMEDWLGSLPVGLIAEHGVWRSDVSDTGKDSHEAGSADSTSVTGPSGRVWRRATDLPDPAVWRPVIEAIMDESVTRLPKSFVEHKSSTLAWHYRRCDQKLAAAERDRLLRRLREVCGKYGLMTMENSKVVEVCPVSISKGLAVVPLAQCDRYDFVLAAGDDTTDETMFAAVPDDGSLQNTFHPRSSRPDDLGVLARIGTDISSWTIKIGAGGTKARTRIADPAEMLRLLGYLATESDAVAVDRG
ncbi:bifunctional alpha,alpha-trehalose-phosphate synthase (UDP-forming)/trehalose-phosphatase [Bifidobacterium sp. ESL0763]|uniref:bifunctional alpha,alpha-trehalose-phosphate synthase (UDP-forming)/trehalose-phosphatase n=1 Tax=Bifidobacterium sp. ESL0763 TaxID=2983227 RepID=UPI0023F6D2F5|nr:bifunctional alpha,alpha-trehalose-phosphate synthase (UDP-forming)/trehalose-phosphatase [Bifidobacterium sp. ESL0763]MDF7663073.1 bifunctional alpha,alpha-trehalose-phosphate synthase (UDP-forming)/trehalose-phosphatase [Bifidobacterium sp. ESL0763]